MKLRSSAPVFVVDNVARTMQWYRDVLGFDGGGFPKSGPPYVFGIVWRDGVEIMLQRLQGFSKADTYQQRPGGTWDVYFRVEGVAEWWEALRDKVPVVEEIATQPYGDTEFVIRDPNGYVLVFSELITTPA